MAIQLDPYTLQTACWVLVNPLCPILRHFPEFGHVEVDFKLMTSLPTVSMWGWPLRYVGKGAIGNTGHGVLRGPVQ